MGSKLRTNDPVEQSVEQPVEQPVEQSAAHEGLLVSELTSIRFAALARSLGEAARSLGHRAPGFRSPPRRPGYHRTIRWEVDGTATISVSLRGRPAVAVIGDMIDGILLAGRVRGRAAVVARDQLWRAAASVIDGEPQGRSAGPAAIEGRRPPARSRRVAA